MTNQLDRLAGYEALNGKRDEASDDCAQLLKFFAERNLPSFTGRDNLHAEFPWNRMFEADISFARR